jgi:PadR family transcriptional regulator
MGIIPSTVEGTVARAQLNLLQGTLDLLLLEALADEPMHGYAVARWVREVTGGTLAIEEGALYTSLHRMERRHWISSEWGVSENNRKAQYYSLTATGRRQLAAEAKTWRRYAEAVFKVLEARATGS